MRVALFVVLAACAQQGTFAVERVEPSSGTNTSDVAVAIVGSNLHMPIRSSVNDGRTRVGAISVLVGDVPLANATLASAEQILGTVPAGMLPGTYPVTVSLGAETVILPDAYTVLASSARRIKLTFRNASRASNLDGFAALIKLDPSRIDYAAVAPNGADLRFMDADGTALPYEIERWDPLGTSIVWVRVPRIDAASDSDFIWLYYGDPTAIDAQTPPAVWPDAVGVWHLAEDPGPGGVDDIKDSSPAGRHGTASPALTSANRVAAMLGDGLELPGDRTGISAASSAMLEYSYQLWLRANADPVTGAGNKQPISNGDTNFNFSWDHNAPEFTAAVAQRDPTMWQSVGDTTLNGGVWHLIAGTYDGTSLCLSVDGGAPSCTPSGPPLAPILELKIGHATSVTSSFAGRLDEVRIVSVARSADWLNAEYASQRDDAANPFVVFGPSEPVP